MDTLERPGEDARLLSLLDRYHTLCRQGQPVSVEALCPGDPALTERLRRHLEAESLLNRISKDSTADTLDPKASYKTPAPPVQCIATEAVPATDRYDVLRKLGAGGMGAVYHARDRVLKRDVALKVIRPDVLTAELRQRFLTEAESVAALDHPGIVKVFDVGEWSPPGQMAAPYLSLEYVPGGSLSRHLGEGPMDVGTAARLVRLLAKAMAHAGARGVVHRDLKPDNVLIAKAADEPGLNCTLGCPKITDFGLAKRVEGQRQTQTGAIMGTPAYMAPEQAEGHPAGPPADVYALGVILYRLLVGKVPFESPSVIELLYKVCREEPVPVRQLRPEVPAALEAICLACMSKDAAKRPSAAELAARLERPCGAAPEGTTVTLANPAPLAGSPPVTRRRLAVGLVAIALVLMGLGAWALWPPAKPAEVSNNGSEDPEPKQPVVTAPAPLTAELVVRVWAPKRGAKGLRIGLDPGAVPVCEDEQLQAEVKLSEPAYCYLLWVDGKGEVTPLYPWNDDEVKVDSVAVAPPAMKAKDFRNPSKASKGWPLDDTPGLDLWLLLVRREPWPAGKSLADAMGKVVAAPLDPDKPSEVAVRGWDNGKFVAALKLLDTTRRPKDKADEIDNQLQRLVGRLQDDFELIRAVQFAHVVKTR